MMDINPADLTSGQKAALIARMKREATRLSAVSRWSNGHRMSVALDDKLRQTQMLDVIAQAVQDAVDRDRGRLIVTSPPQIGKSNTIAIWGAVRALVGNPDLRVVVASYSESLARRHVRTARDLVSRYGSDAQDSLTRMPLPDRLGISLSDRKATETEWQVAGHQGGMYGVGVGGSLSGSAADCIDGQSVLYSERGQITAEEAYADPPRYLLGYDKRTGQPTWHRLEAARRIDRRPVVTVTTRGGQSLTCTADHRVYTGGGYTPAGSLRPGETLLHSPAPTRMPQLRGTIHSETGGCQEGCNQESPVSLLTELRFGERIKAISGEFLPLWESGPTFPKADLLRRMPEGDSSGEEPTRGLPGMWRGVYRGFFPDGLLLSKVRRPSALEEDDRGGELTSQASVITDLPIQADTTLHYGEGRAQVRDLLDRDGSGRSSLRRGPSEQSVGEFDNPMWVVPHNTSQIEYDTVSLVTAAGEATVYDFQVDGDHNFFANGLLVHNCLIIDDPLKGMAEADSATYKDRLLDWWRSVALARLSPTASVVVVQTRWVKDDLAGVLLDEGGWEYLNFPAVSQEGIPDALNRRPGTPLRTSRGHTPDTWDKTERAVGPRVWSALYQGMPTPLSGGLFGADVFDRYRQVDVPPLRLRMVAVDPAETGKGDEAGLIAGGIDREGRIVVTHDRSARMTSDEWSRAAVVLALETKATELSFEGYTTAVTYERVIRDAWRNVEGDLRLIRRHGGDVALAAAALDGDALSRLAPLAGLSPSDSDRPPFRVRSWRGKGDKVARASGARQGAEVGRLYMGGTFPGLEGQAVTWQVGQSSPDRVDAMVQLYERLREVVGKPALISVPGGRSPSGSGLGSRLSTRLE